MDLLVKSSRIAEEEHAKRMTELHEKYNSGVSLSLLEQYDICDNATPDWLLKNRIGQDVFYSRYYLDYTAGAHSLRWKIHHETYFKSMVKEWSTEMQKTNHKDQLLKINAEETRKQLNAHRKQYRLLPINYTLEQYLHERFKILSWSKYRYLAVKRTNDLILKGRHYKLHLDGKELSFDFHSLIHIVSRHFGEAMKPYDSQKDHFHKDFYYDNAHLKLETIFKQIDDSRRFEGQAINDINFRYDGQIYKLYCKKRTTSQKGKHSVDFMHIETFFPVTNERMLKKLADEFIEYKVDDLLSVFVLK